jgi:Winged helix-turn helix
MDRGVSCPDLSKPRRLTTDEGQYLLRLVRRGGHDSVLYRRALVIMVSACGTGAPAIARLVIADPDTVRDVIHTFNAQGMAGLSPRWGGGRLRRITDEDIEDIDRPEEARVAVHGTGASKLTADLGGRSGHHDPDLVPAQAVRIGRERVRRIPHEHDISFSALDLEDLNRPGLRRQAGAIEEVMSRLPDWCFAAQRTR